MSGHQRHRTSPQLWSGARLDLVEGTAASPKTSPTRHAAYPRVASRHVDDIDENPEVAAPSSFYSSSPGASPKRKTIDLSKVSAERKPTPVQPQKPDHHFTSGEQCVLRRNGEVVTYITSNDAGYHTVISAYGVVSQHLGTELKPV